MHQRWGVFISHVIIDRQEDTADQEMFAAIYVWVLTNKDLRPCHDSKVFAQPCFTNFPILDSVDNGPILLSTAKQGR